MLVKNTRIEDVKPYPRNPRLIPDGAVRKVAASIQEFGWRQPIVVDGKGVIIAGHTRLQAAQKLGMDTVPVHVAKGLSEAQIRAYRLADNRTNDEAQWDFPALALEFGDLGELDLELTGFDLGEIDAILATAAIGEGLTDPDDAPAAPEHPVTAAGYIWQCGKHRVICGDATVATDVERLLDGVTPMLMVTDPPWGVQYDAKWRGNAGAIGVVLNDDRADWSEAWSLFLGDVAYVWHAPGALSVVFYASLQATGFQVRMQIIWAKSKFVIGRGHYHVGHEPCWYAVRKGGKGHWQGSRKESTLWQIEHRKSETGHSTQKPVECMKRPIDNNSSPGQAVYDPFLGSGTTMIAAEMTGRVCYGIELHPPYVDVSVERWQNFTGRDAVNEIDGMPFNAYKEARQA